MFLIACLKRLPLPLLILLNFGIGNRLLLFDGFSHTPVFHALLFQLDEVRVENMIQLLGSFFGQLAPLRVEEASIATPLARSFC